MTARLESIGLAAVRKRFSPEFVNRIDVVITYQQLNADALSEILDHHLGDLQRHVHRRLGERSFDIEVTPAARHLLLEKGASAEYGARELKRTIHRMLAQPLATLVADRQVQPGGHVTVDAATGAAGWASAVAARVPARRARRASPGGGSWACRWWGC